jgi:hypothetical protein
VSTGLKADYSSLEREFITTDISLRAMAKREQISNGTLSERARRPDAAGKTWLEKREEYKLEVERRYLKASAESRAVQLSRLADLSVSVLEAALTRLAIQLAGDPDENGNPRATPMEVPVKEGLEVIRQIQTLRGLPSNISEERQVVGHFADPRLLEAIGDLARATLRPDPVVVGPRRSLPGPVEGAA